MAEKLINSSKKEERKVKYHDAFKPNIEQKSDVVKSQQYVKKKLPEKIELTQEQVWDLKRPKYVLYDTKEKPSSDTRTPALRNADYWDPIKGASERNKSLMDNGKHPIQGLTKTVGTSALIATGALELPALATWGGLGSRVLVGGAQGVGYGNIGLSTGNAVNDFTYGAMGEVGIPAVGGLLKGAKAVYKSSPSLIKKGYKEIKVPEKQFKSEIDWVDFVKKNNKSYDIDDIKSIKSHKKEYDFIEFQSKNNGTWMKNPDGSVFKGTPEQFVQQNSSDFKKFIANRDKEILYHNSPNEFVEFLTPSSPNYKKGKYTTTGEEGIYFGPNKNIITQYLGDDPSLGNTYAIYTNANIKRAYEPIDNISSYRKNILESEGFHGIQDLGTIEKEIAIFDPKRIKSALGNNGDFALTKGNMYKGLIPAAGLYGLTQSKKQGGNMKYTSLFKLGGAGKILLTGGTSPNPWFKERSQKNNNK